MESTPIAKRTHGTLMCLVTSSVDNVYNYFVQQREQQITKVKIKCNST